MFNGDVVFAERLSVHSYNIHRGDIVLATSPQKRHELLCKRVVHKERDPIEYRQKIFPPLPRVPRGHCYLVGDNQQFSTDSRNIGPLPMGLIELRVVYRIWPLSRIGSLSTHGVTEKERDQP
jgi:signal peptidase I